MSGISGDKKLAAESIWGFAVKTFAGFFTWSFNIKSLCIHRSSYISCTFHGAVKVGTDFIYANNKNNFLWSLGDTREPVD